jgi:hypothetical protein
MRVTLLLPILGLSVCSNPQPLDPQIEVPLGEPFVLRIGQAAEVAGTPLHVRFDEVREDSRCPADVACVWAGNARVRLRVDVESDEAVSLDLNTGLDPRALSLAEYRIALEALEPAPASTASIPDGQYLARLRVTSEP